MDKNLVQRSLSGIIYAIVVFLCTTPFGSKLLATLFGQLGAVHFVGQRYLYYGFLTLLLVGGLYECLRMMKLKSWLWIAVSILGTAYIFYRFSVQYFTQHFFGGLNSMDLFAMILLIMAVITVFRVPEEMKYDNGKAIFLIVYLSIPFGLALGLPDFIVPVPTYFSYDAFMLFVLIWSSDTFAYFTGRFFGKHKMAPKISPKKTWEGLIGGALLTIILGVVFQLTIHDLKGNWIIVGVLVAIFAPLGDLVESQLKRTFHVKDSWMIIPGHGGVLDRLDSFILCAPVVYIYFMIINLF